MLVTASCSVVSKQDPGMKEVPIVYKDTKLSFKSIDSIPLHCQASDGSRIFYHQPQSICLTNPTTFTTMRLSSVYVQESNCTAKTSLSIAPSLPSIITEGPLRWKDTHTKPCIYSLPRPRAGDDYYLRNTSIVFREEEEEEEEGY